ncbi:MAG: hypothetical protein ABSC21_18560, partial [Terriglobia bacterium]
CRSLQPLWSGQRRFAPIATGITSESLTGIKSESVTTFIGISKPTRSKFEQDTYDETKKLLDSYDENHKVLFRHLLRHGKMTKILGAKLSPLPPGFREELAASILDKLISDQLVTSDGHPSPSGWTASWQIAPGVKSIIKELLWSNLPAKLSTLTFKLHHYRN